MGTDEKPQPGTAGSDAPQERRSPATERRLSWFRAVATDLADIYSKGAFLASLFVFPAFTFAGCWTFLTDPVKPLVAVIFGTWPLVCSATIFGMLWLRGAFERISGMQWVFLPGALILGPYLVAYAAGAAGYVDPRAAGTTDWLQLLHPGHLVAAVGNVLLYYVGFGVSRVLPALIAGGFLAWAFEIKLLPHFRRGD